MCNSLVGRCFSIFRFIFVKHVIKRKSLKLAIKRIRIYDDTTSQHGNKSTQTNDTDKMGNGIQRLSQCSMCSKSSYKSTDEGIVNPQLFQQVLTRARYIIMNIQH